MPLPYRPRLGPGLLGLPSRVPLAAARDGRWRSPTYETGPLVREADPAETVAVHLLLPPGEGLWFEESDGAELVATYPPPHPGSAFTGPATMPMTLVSPGPPRFSHVLLIVRAHYVGYRDVYLRQRVVALVGGAGSIGA